jgi:hypothetical protein
MEMANKRTNLQELGKLPRLSPDGGLFGSLLPYFSLHGSQALLHWLDERGGNQQHRSA